MAALVWVLLVVAAATGSFPYQNHLISSNGKQASCPIRNTSGEEQHSSVDAASPACPHGEQYMLECNWCTCNEADPYEWRALCTLKGCVDWTCEAHMREIESYPGCSGTCSCDDATTVTRCDSTDCYPGYPRKNKKKQKV